MGITQIISEANMTHNFVSQMHEDSHEGKQYSPREQQTACGLKISMDAFAGAKERKRVLCMFLGPKQVCSLG